MKKLFLAGAFLFSALVTYSAENSLPDWQDALKRYLQEIEF